jgi:phospholipid/cholesterol/gamma-HCH transport system substrate-binding protein
MTMNEPGTPDTPPPRRQTAIANVEFKATVLLVLMLALIAGAVAYVMYARGVFESTQRLVLVAEDSEGVLVGMDLTFSGFPIGRVRRIELADDGKARILVDVSRKDVKWLRTSSIFTMERGLVGDTKLRAFSGVLTDAPLPEGAVRNVLRGDATAEIPRLLASVHALVDNLEAMTKADSTLNQTLEQVQGATQGLNDGLKGKYGALGFALGGEANAKKVLTLLDTTNTLLLRADQRIFGDKGVLVETQATIAEVHAMLVDARNSLKKVDAVLVEAQAIGANTKNATADLGTLRAQVEASLRKVDALVNEVNRKWPFARDAEIKLP